MKAKRKRHIADFKKEIIKYVRENQKKLAKTFLPARKPEYLDKALKEINWVHIDKYYPVSYNYEIVVEFDCRPYNGELKAYIYLTADECLIENTIVQAE